MSNVTNLNQVRKARARLDKKRRADENAVKFGRTKAERQRDTQAGQRDLRHLDGHRLDQPPQDD